MTDTLMFVAAWALLGLLAVCLVFACGVLLYALGLWLVCFTRLVRGLALALVRWVV